MPFLQVLPLFNAENKDFPDISIEISSEPLTNSEIFEAGMKLMNIFTSGSAKIPSFHVKDWVRVILDKLKTF